MAQRLAELVDEAIRELLATSRGVYVQFAQILLERQLHKSCTLLAQAGLQWCTKVTAHVPAYERLAKSLHERNRRPEESSWPEWDREQISTEITAIHEDILSILARCLPDLVGTWDRGRRPDLFGQTFHTLAATIYSALRSGNSPLLARLLPSFFIAVLQAHDQLIRDTQGWPDSVSAFFAVTEPVVELMELSGYALIYSELYDKPAIWANFRANWDGYFQARQDGRSVCSQLLNMYQVRKNFVRFTLHGTTWELQCKQSLTSAGAGPEDYYHPRFNPRRPVHKSSVIRALTGGGPCLDPVEVFLHLYLSHRPEFAGLSVEDRHGFAQRLERETSGASERDSDDWFGDEEANVREPGDEGEDNP